MKTNIGVFFGGRSTEHEISVISASQAMHAINRDKYDVTPIYITKQGHWYTGEALLDVKNYRNIPELLKQCEEVYMRPVYDDYNLYKGNKKMFGSNILTRLDVVIPVLHGSNVEDGIFEGVLQTIGIPYAGCDVLSSANGMDKITMKMILQANDVPVVDLEHLGSDLQEINCSVLGDCDDYRMSVLEEPIKSGDFLTYDQKYLGGGKGAKGMQSSQKRIPAELPKEETERIQYLAGETFRVLSCHGVSRVDVIIDRSTREVYVNEINTIPGSLSFYLWEATGLPFDKLMDTLVQLALKRKRNQSLKTVSYDQNIFSLGGGVKGAKGTKA